MDDAIQARHGMEQVNVELRTSEARYRTLFSSIDEGFCVVEMLFNDGGKPVDYRFLETNPGFEKQTGLCGATGKRMRELSPHHRKHLVGSCGGTTLRSDVARAVMRKRHYTPGKSIIYFAIHAVDATRVSKNSAQRR